MGGDDAGAHSASKDVFAALYAGNQRFVSGEPEHGPARPGEGRQRRPQVAVITCMDGRVPVEAAFDQQVGALCTIRTAGHVLGRATLGSLELAVAALGVDAVLVLGHRGCAAVEQAVAVAASGPAPGAAGGHILSRIMPAVADAGPDAATPEVVEAHVRRCVAEIRRTARLPHGGEQAVAGAVYDLETGRVTPVA